MSSHCTRDNGMNCKGILVRPEQTNQSSVLVFPANTKASLYNSPPHTKDQTLECKFDDHVMY